MSLSPDQKTREIIIPQSLRQDAQDIYKYLRLESDFSSNEPGGIIFLVGGAELEAVADKAYQLWLEDQTRLFVAFTTMGNYSNHDVTANNLSEADIYKNLLLERGVPENSIYIDPVAPNTTLEARKLAGFLKDRSGIYPEGTLIHVVDIPVHQKREDLTLKYELENAGLSDVKLIHHPAEVQPNFEDINFLKRLAAEIERLSMFLEMKSPSDLTLDLKLKEQRIRMFLQEHGLYVRKDDYDERKSDHVWYKYKDARHLMSFNADKVRSKAVRDQSETDLQKRIAKILQDD